LGIRQLPKILVIFPIFLKKISRKKFGKLFLATNCNKLCNSFSERYFRIILQKTTKKPPKKPPKVYQKTTKKPPKEYQKPSKDFPCIKKTQEMGIVLLGFSLPYLKI
jgi:hypothetical protein